MDHVADRLCDCVINIQRFMRPKVRIPSDAHATKVAVLYQILVITTVRLDKTNSPLPSSH